jgi:hypothetical protein
MPSPRFTLTTAAWIVIGASAVGFALAAFLGLLGLLP